MKTSIIALLAGPGSAFAVSIDDLWITEVRPSTGQVEVTNVGDGPITTASSLPFCHRFRYSDNVPSGTTFARGESKVFSVTLSNPADSDLWIYRGGSFGVAANIITGLKWGGEANVGRTAIATTAGKWTSPNLPVPTAAQSLHLTKAAPFQSTSWSVGAPDLGKHAFPFGPVEASLSGSMIDLSWSGGSGPFRVETSPNLVDWEFLTGLVEDREHSTALNVGEMERFYRIQGQATLEESADFRLTFTSLWSETNFATVPGNDHFSGLVGGMHNASINFWNPGVLASSGIEDMAEGGSKTELLQEVLSAITAGTAQQTLSGSGLGGAGSETTLDFTAQRSHPLISITSMIAPSPDWFVGLHDQTLLKTNDDWIESMTFELVSYDAGTDSGTTFTSGDQNTSPAQPIFLIPATDPNFAPATGSPDQPIPIARIVITRLP